MAPTRRSVLSALCSAGVLGLAGCLGGSGGVGAPETDSPTVSPTDPPAGTGSPDDETPTPESPTTTPSPSPEPSGEPRFESLSFESTGGSCGQSSSATITASGRIVEVEGSVLTSTPCYTAKLRSSAVDADAARFVVHAEENEGTDACQQCLGEIRFSLTASLGGPMPDEAVVEIQGTDSKTVRKSL